MKLDLPEAGRKLPQLVQAALAGDEVIIADRGSPAVCLVPIEKIGQRRQPGAWSALPPPADDWDSPEFNREIADSLAR